MLLVLDQITKLLAESYLKSKESIILIQKIFRLEYLENRGAAFGILQGQRWFFLILAILVLLAVLIIYWRLPLKKRFIPIYLCLVLIAGGAVGNSIDRFANGYVVDFLYFNLINFPIFNVADIYVTIAAVLIIIFIGLIYREDDFTELKRSILRHRENVK